MTKKDYIALLFFLCHIGLSISLFSQNPEVFLANQSNIEPPTNTTSREHLLTDHIKDLEKQFQVFILFESELLEDITISYRNLAFKKTVESHLIHILRNTGLEFIKVADTTYVLVRSKRPSVLFGKVIDKNGQALTGATILIKEKNTGIIANIDGEFEVQLPSGHHELEARYVGYSPKVFEVDILPNDSFQLDMQLNSFPSLQEVVIVGSRFSEVSLLKRTEPTNIIKAEELNIVGQSETAQMLQYTVPSFHSTPQTISDGTDHIDPATLRGLGPDQLLVLINGKRRHHSALVNINGTIGKGTVATDLNAIPTAAIERIEILRDGAASQYGSDAIAGVINIVLKKNTNIVDINLSSGITQEGDGATHQLSGNYGVQLGTNGGFLNLTMDFQHRGNLNRSGNYTGKIFGDSRDYDEAAKSSFFQQTGYKDHRVTSVGAASITNAGLFLNAEYPLGEKTKLYAAGGISYRMGNAAGFYRFPYQVERQSGIYLMGFSPKLQTTIFDNSITIGLRTKDLPFQIDLSNTTGGNSFDFAVKNSNNASLGLVSPKQTRAGGFSYDQNVTNLDISKKSDGFIPILWGIGSEFRLENYRQKAGDESSYIDGGVLDANGQPREIGFQMFPGFQSENEVDEYRYNLGIYTNIEAEITKKLQINSALRYEYYSDFGSNFTGKIGSRFSINEVFTVRGTFNTGFRAPSMPQVHFSSLGFQFISEGNEQKGIQVAHFNNQNSVTQQFGIQPLKAERSQNLSFGFASQILKNLSFTFDAYQIDIKDRIVITGRFSKEDALLFQQILEPTGISKAQFFTNAIDTRTRGIDLHLDYRIHFKTNTLHLAAAANFNKTLLHKNADGKPNINALEYLYGFENILFNREEISRIEVAQPNNKVILRAHLKTKKMEWMFAMIRFGKVQYIHPDDGVSENWVLNENTGVVESRDQVFSPKWISDLSIKYHLTNRIAFNLGGNNIFNVYPDRHLHSANIANGIFQYSRRVQQFGVRGAYWYGKLNFRF